MKKKDILHRFILIMFFLSGLCSWNLLLSQINVMHIDNNAVTQAKEGIFYALPRTNINIDVSIDRVENYKGPYGDYAMRYLGLKNVVESNSVEYRINYIRITTSAEPDPDQYYLINFSGKSDKNEVSNFLTLSESGLIVGVLPERSDTGRKQPPKSNKWRHLPFRRKKFSRKYSSILPI